MKKTGDVVSVFGNRGKVISIIKNGSSDIWKSDLLEVKFEDGSINTYAESVLDNFKEPKLETEVESLDLNTKDKIINILKKIELILKSLDIKPNELNSETQIDAAFKLFCYIVNSSQYDENIMKEKGKVAQNYTSLEEMEIDDIYKCLCTGRGVCTSDASSLALLLRQINIEATHITIADKATNKGVHEIVKLKLNNKYYVCDPTLVRSSLQNKTISQINESIFLFDPTTFFNNIYPNKEIKWEHKTLNIEVWNDNDDYAEK